jgi:hypothetical protein
MIGVLLTSTCFYNGIDEKTFEDRIEELLVNILSLKKHVNQEFELIIADNSPPDCIPTEIILKLCSQTTLFIRLTYNPGKDIGEAILIRDGVHLSFARGHKWLLKLTGRYFLEGNWALEESISELEKTQKFLYVHLIGRRMMDMPWAKGHPFYEENLHTEKILPGVATQAFIVNPEYLVNKKVFQKDYFYKELQWVNFEQKFWYAIKELGWLYWPNLPINGFVGNRNSNRTVQEMLTTVSNLLFKTIAHYTEIPSIDISSLIEAD